jgi:hypothetical protein
MLGRMPEFLDSTLSVFLVLASPLHYLEHPLEHANAYYMRFICFYILLCMGHIMNRANGPYTVVSYLCCISRCMTNWLNGWDVGLVAPESQERANCDFSWISGSS